MGSISTDRWLGWGASFLQLLHQRATLPPPHFMGKAVEGARIQAKDKDKFEQWCYTIFNVVVIEAWGGMLRQKQKRAAVMPQWFRAILSLGHLWTSFMAWREEKKPLPRGGNNFLTLKYFLSGSPESARYLFRLCDCILARASLTAAVFNGSIFSLFSIFLGSFIWMPSDGISYSTDNAVWQSCQHRQPAGSEKKGQHSP